MVPCRQQDGLPCSAGPRCIGRCIGSCPRLPHMYIPFPTQTWAVDKGNLRPCDLARLILGLELRIRLARHFVRPVTDGSEHLLHHIILDSAAQGFVDAGGLEDSHSQADGRKVHRMLVNSRPNPSWCHQYYLFLSRRYWQCQDSYHIIRSYRPGEKEQ